MAITHAFTSGKSDEADATLVRPSNWNAAHVGSLDPLDIPTATAPSQTTEGRAIWDSNDDELTIGDGTSRKLLIPTSDAVLIGTAAAKPAAGKPGRLYGESDTGLVKRDSGTAWVEYMQYSLRVDLEGTEVGSRRRLNFIAGEGTKLTLVDDGASSPAKVDVTIAQLGVTKTADETVNNSTTLQNDNHLTFAVDANTVYVVEALIVYESSTVADFKGTFVAPAGATGGWTAVSGTGNTATNIATTASSVLKAFAAATSWGGSGAGNPLFLSLLAYVVVGGTAGSLTFQWAQDTAEVSDTKVLKGSFERYRKVA